MKNFLLLSAIYLFSPQLAAGEDHEELRSNLMEKMPQFTIGEIRKLPYVDLYEIQCNGINVFYTDAKGEVALSGNLMELQTRTHLEQPRHDRVTRNDVLQKAHVMTCMPAFTQLRSK